jgi:two-component system, chemotaxis family, CheB/CheR fusion protein
VALGTVPKTIRSEGILKTTRKRPARAAKADRTKRSRAPKAKRPSKFKRAVAAAPKEPAPSEGDHFLVVGLGASAGGLEAVRKLLAVLPAKTGFAFILIQHLDPTHRSMLAELLARDTAMEVVQVTDGMPLAPDRLHIIPPHAYLALDGGVLRISAPRPSTGARMPLDFFLNSLAKQYGERAVAVILSGTGTDGSVGATAVSENGGLVIAQEPDEASYAGMSRSAIATGTVNLVLPAAKIPAALINYAQHPYVTARRRAVLPVERPEEGLNSLITLLRMRTARDFARYKTATLLRRTQRRMAAAGIKDIEDYVKLLRQDDRELELLAKDLLIHVTGFFRDPAAFAALAKTVIPGLMRQHKDDEPIRVWVPACSTGEEAYSIAMLFMEAFAAAKRSMKLQVFASDVSGDAVAYGRNGLYPDSIKADVSEDRLARFFTRDHGSYRVSRDLRDAIVFTVQDVLSDPPFSHLDLVSCRNLLIYLLPNEQEKVLTLLHFALRESGYLFLGTSETIGRLTDHFEPIADTLRIFRRIGAVQPHARMVAPLIVDRSRALWPRLVAPAEAKEPSFGDLVKARLLEVYAPAAVLVNRKYQGLYFLGATDRYLRVAPGEPSRDLRGMLRNGLPSMFRAAVRQASETHEVATIRGGQVKRNGDTVTVCISARPVQHQGEELVLVTFADEPERRKASTDATPADASRAEQVERELETTRRELELTIRDLQASNQELTSLNEEAISMNEEFQSTNEELESSREELQSMNEELTTVNSELQESLDRERKGGDDLKNILNSADVATLFLDNDLHVRFFTPAAAPLFNLIATDIGRPLADLAVRFEGVDLQADARTVLSSLTPLRRDVKIASGSWYLCSISPYRTEQDRAEGVVINLANISSFKEEEEKLRAAHTYTEAIIDTIREPLVVLDGDLRVVSASQSFYRFFGAQPADTLGRPLPDTDAHHLDVPQLREFLDRLTGGARGLGTVEIAIDVPPLGPRVLVVTAEQIHEATPTNNKILISFTDITDLKRSAEEAVAKRAAEQANLEKSRFLAAASHDIRQPLQALTLLRDALEQRVRDEQGREMLARMERVLDSMSGLVAGLLDINQLETGAVRPILVDFPVMEVLDALHSEFFDQARSKGLGWRLVHCGLAAHTDRRLFTEILRNLLSNAIRYTDEGKILLGCRRHGSNLRIEVWDTGIGIPEEQLPHIFEENYQITAVDATRRGGLGLGLAIVQRLAELLNHPVGVRSRIGKGTVFFIEVPLAGPAPQPAKQAEESQRRTSGRTGTILVIEDEPTVRDMLAATLKAKGHRVVAVSNGQPALDLVTKDGLRPDLLISDYSLPGKFTGAEIAATLRSTLGWQIPAIILSGDVRSETRQDVGEKGLFNLVKPVDAATLSSLIEQLLASSPRAAVAPTTAPAAERLPAAGAGTIFVVDDDRDIREAMRAVLSQAGHQVNTSADAQSFLSSHRPGDTGCVIVDVRMPGMNGLEMLARLSNMDGGKLPAIVITGQGDIAMAVEAMRAGAVDFIEKPIDANALLTSVNRALRQAATPAERSAVGSAAAMRIAGLTKREREVMRLVVSGVTNKEIAARLGINQRTVETHRAALMKKIGASSLSDLVRLDIASGGVGSNPAND